ncbi:hypothetical protein FKG94_19075 [Exilibacterium tricleocarpae]|uniref:Polysaccharide lyase n=1 Tax=Exilibacterium tricleocarpae TaxID=2591008 RepID=A0A545T3F7_9GAMM|nr:heparin lyase I family protein [Exilibacterium tricleocarpae]TQV71753.1 hypothetical protein FKG94_19075 [Exilibacterium tricleocarpae]
MKQVITFRTRIKICAFILFASSPGYAWEVIKSFEDGTLGEKAERNADSFDDIAGHSRYSNEFSYVGSQSAKLHTTAGEEGFGRWGGAVQFPTELGKGDHLWTSLAMRVPKEFDFQTTTGSLKWLRWASEKGDGSGNGFLDLQVMNDDPSTLSGSDRGYDFRIFREGEGVKLYGFGEDGSLKRDRWHKFDIYIKFDDRPAAQGGTGLVRIWLDNTLIYTQAEIRTLHQATDYFHSLFMFTYWNGGAPKSQHLYIDEIKLSNEEAPSWTEQLGRPKSPPKPVTGVVVERIEINN